MNTSWRNALRSLTGVGADTPDAAVPESGVVAMLGVVGPALLASSRATNDVESTLRRLAHRYGRNDLRVFVLPTVILIEDGGARSPRTAVFAASGTALRLDQADAIERLLRRALDSAPAPADVTSGIERVVSGTPRFGWPLTLLGHVLLTVGFGLVLNPTLTALPIYVLLGILVGGIVMVGSRITTLSLLLPVVTAFVVALMVSVFIRPLVHDDVLRLVAPSLVSFLPGLTLTIAAVELTSGQIMAGASRLVYGIARLGLLAFGLYAGLSVAGAPHASAPVDDRLGSWAPWVGIALVSLGYYLFSSAPRGSLLWILYALVAAYSAQLLGNVLVGAQLSGFIGAAVAVPLIYLAGRIRSGAPTAIMLTCSYWLLVPGAMGFIGVSEAASGAAGATATILQTFGSLIAIAVGMMIGGAVSRDVGAFATSLRRSRSEAPTA
ncbi:threonine/serine exporter family protein [Microbacterium sp. SSW1-59]|uniref:threonine/serine ThrE exporter family protein n=1 Tax=Microbacterium xanthum TaxID=3079794 RepID=UPI002AD39EEF|nr:threonine/serine exporter family protein [Microbacterium sp. SSW1-59]MDZ8200427.1 threonine/serine exporter family protein [Microbacterium sp. SSW1-59]